MKAKLQVLDQQIGTTTKDGIEYINITDIARFKNNERTDIIIGNWLRNRNTVEFLGIWEQLNNPAFKPIEFDGFRKQAGLNSFTLTPKQWIEQTGAIGLISGPGATVAPSPRRTSPSSSPAGSRWSSSSTSSRSSSG